MTNPDAQKIASHFIQIIGTFTKSGEVYQATSLIGWLHENTSDEVKTMVLAPYIVAIESGNTESRPLSDAEHEPTPINTETIPGEVVAPASEEETSPPPLPELTELERDETIVRRLKETTRLRKMAMSLVIEQASEEEAQLPTDEQQRLQAEREARFQSTKTKLFRVAKAHAVEAARLDPALPSTYLILSQLCIELNELENGAEYLKKYKEFSSVLTADFDKLNASTQPKSQEELEAMARTNPVFAGLFGELKKAIEPVPQNPEQ